MLEDLLLAVFVLGGFLLMAAVFRGELKMFGQTVNTHEMGIAVRILVGILGALFLMTAVSFGPPTGNHRLILGLAALVLGGMLALVAVVRGKFGASVLVLDGEAVSGWARAFAGIAAFAVISFAVRTIFGSPEPLVADVVPAPTASATIRTLPPPPIQPPPGNAPRPPIVWNAQTYIQLASEKLEEDATARALQEAERVRAQVCVFESKRAFGIALGPLKKAGAAELLASLKAAGQAAEDAFVAPIDDSQVKSCFAPQQAVAF